MRVCIILLAVAGVTGVGAGVAATSPAGGGGGVDPSVGLKTTVATLSEKSKKAAPEYAQMAKETIQLGSNPEAVQKMTLPQEGNPDPQAPWRNMIGDALAGVDEGEKIDKKAADWPKLREELKSLQPPPPPVKKSSPKDKKKDKEEKDKKSGKEKGKLEKKSGKGEKSQEKDKGGEEGDGEQDKGDSQGPPSPVEKGKGDEAKDGDSGQEPGQGEQGGQQQE